MSQVRTNSIVPVGGIPAGSNGGGIIQCVSTTKTDTFSTTASGFTDVTGLSVTITPRSSSNKILIYASISMGHSEFYNENFYWKILRDSTSIAVSTSATSVSASGGHNMYLSGGNVPFAAGSSKMHLDSPATTSATTYKIQISKNAAAATIFVNRRASDLDTGTVSNITVMEVSG